ncbi:uncharacterized protein TRAVEDRAFT_50933 [Trametes versicolor FP-101664 SS1]|uniref:uncharacterized protein n=1 Tax=Trametes versicolor (strain FP-101664) TaxID=717944 RepID=UPI000462494C|nr:uncharacterized protein TRAVEDRAFT_50933 [Trametes versicolor FP-101664 SS1]EIW54797.1 hypothetical protein TRAVEDRAFT_50933 [Trametes versicolor FP-101664 SS1]
MSIDKSPSDSHRPKPPPGPPTPDDASSVVSYRTDSPAADQGDAFAASVRTSSGRNSGANTRIDNAGDAHVHARGHASGRSATAPTQDRSNAQGDAGARPTDATHPVMPAATNPLPRLPRDRLRENAQAGPSEPPPVRPSVYSGAMWQHEPAHRVATPPQSILVGGSGARARQPDTPRRPQSGASTVDEGYTTAVAPSHAGIIGDAVSVDNTLTTSTSSATTYSFTRVSKSTQADFHQEECCSRGASSYPSTPSTAYGAGDPSAPASAAERGVWSTSASDT